MQHKSHYINTLEAPEKRRKSCENGLEHHFTEAAILIAFAMHLFDNEAAKRVTINPDGEHAKRHEMVSTLARNGFAKISSSGSTPAGGVYQRGDQYLTLSFRSGQGDVSADINGRLLIAECKGGVINTKHAGQVSRLRKGLCEAIGQLMSRDLGAERHVAVVPDTATTRGLAKKMIGRTRAAMIEIALIDPFGLVHFQSQSGNLPVSIQISVADGGSSYPRTQRR